LEQILTDGTVTGRQHYCADLLLMPLKHGAWLFYGKDVGLGLTVKRDESARAIQTAAGPLRYTMWNHEDNSGDGAALTRLAAACPTSYMLEHRLSVLDKYDGAAALARRLAAGKTWCLRLPAEVSHHLTGTALSFLKTDEEWANLLSFVETARRDRGVRAGG
jgi:hypothetical protein